jgi:hypothetical protein
MRAHCCIKVANIAQVKLIVKLKNQGEFTQTTYFCGEKRGGLSGVEGMDC